MERPTGVRHVMVAVTTLVAVMLYLDRVCLSIVGEAIKKKKGEQAQYEEIILGITKASLNTDSFLSEIGRAHV